MLVVALPDLTRLRGCNVALWRLAMTLERVNPSAPYEKTVKVGSVAEEEMRSLGQSEVCEDSISIFEESPSLIG